MLYRYGNICFDLSGFKGKFSNLEFLKNQSGYLSLYNLGISYKNRYENKLIFSGYCDNGEILDQKQMQRMFRLSGVEDMKKENIFNPDKKTEEKLDNLFKLEQEHILNEISIQDSNYFEEEATKLDKWANDIKIDSELKLKSIDKSIDEINVKLRARNLTLKQRLDLQEKLTELEPKRKELRMKIYYEQDKIDEQRKQLIEETKEKLILKTESKKIFTIRWRII